ncbi:unnamed protein product [Durusdinium trenchii]|uniref:Uncharacterized protein n=1 Tax=Durusdinium trenchii TaxID=1381693 RepID=A0ABP0QKY2_9DINO
MVRVDNSRVDSEWLSMKEADPDEAEEEVAEGDAADGQTALDTTVLADPLSDEEREVLTKLRKHESEVSKVCSAAQELRVKGAQSAVDLRSLVEAADGVERLLDAAEDAELLQREAVSSQVDWPAEELKYARVIVLALDAWETALAKGKEQLTAEAAGGAIYSSLGALLRSFRELREAEAQAQASGSAAVQHADLGLAGKETALRPLSEALLDKALELKGEALQSFRTQLLNDEGQMEMLKDLRVQLPDLQSGEEEAPILLSQVKGIETETEEAQDTGPLDPERLWRAVHTGDESIVKAFVGRKACDGRTRDASGHSIFWHAISFHHHSLAQYIWETFPPGTATGVEVDEVHERKGDTLLHLLCMSRPFNAEVAALFKRVAAKAPPPVFQKQNALGLSFLEMAIDSLNFWVLSFVLKNFKVQAKALLCNARAPLRRLLKALRPPNPPEAYEPPPGFPDHFRVAAMLQQEPNGLVPYADVAFDVGPERQGVATGRFFGASCGSGGSKPCAV